MASIIDPSGNGKVVEHRLYQLIRQKELDGLSRTLKFEVLLIPNVQVFSFTFG